MFKKKCSSCGKKVDKKYSYCPYCGISFKLRKEQDDFGLIGREDSFEEVNEEMKLPLGLDKVMGSLIKQLERQLNVNNNNSEMPRGFKIQISTGKPVMREVKNIEQIKPEQKIIIPEKELERRKGLPKVEAESNLRRLNDRIVYEFFVPGVKSNSDIAITKLENSIEIRAYSKDKCYVKTIPLRLEIIRYYVKDKSLFLELKA